jgi:hypothetical protein
LKKTIRAFLVIIALACSGVFSINPACAEKASSGKVIVYYFYGTVRCSTCHKLEQYSKETLENNFKEELASGKLEFKAINVEDKGNGHYLKDYQLYTKSLILSLVKEDKQIKWTNLNKIWEYVGDKQKFSDYVKGEVTDLLKESQ